MRRGVKMAVRSRMVVGEGRVIPPFGEGGAKPAPPPLRCACMALTLDLEPSPIQYYHEVVKGRCKTRHYKKKYALNQLSS